MHERTSTVTVRTDQELRQSFVDMGYIRNVLMSVNPTVLTDPLAPSIEVLAPRNGPSDLEFRYCVLFSLLSAVIINYLSIIL